LFTWQQIYDHDNKAATTLALILAWAKAQSILLAVKPTASKLMHIQGDNQRYSPKKDKLACCAS